MINPKFSNTACGHGLLFIRPWVRGGVQRIPQCFANKLYYWFERAEVRSFWPWKWLRASLVYWRKTSWSCYIVLKKWRETMFSTQQIRLLCAAVLPIWVLSRSWRKEEWFDNVPSVIIINSIQFSQLIRMKKMHILTICCLLLNWYKP